ncbi:BrnT family toxin [Candidatus Saccharibacteria bacterium]|nr:BrnT family toxin [Candidatus Saccharibacteria bacterium]
MVKSIDGIKVEWSESKNAVNVKKHGLSFETAALVFEDVNRVEFYDTVHSVGEDRYITIGIVNKLITVVYTERVKALRIISARVATAAERKIYHGKNH